MMRNLKKILLFVVVSVLHVGAMAQCSICTKTASQLGRESAEGLNGGIVYLMITPFVLAGYIGYRWWKQEKANNNNL
jgi:hypothetical protein